MIFVRPVNERLPVLRDRFCWVEGVGAQDRFYCRLIARHRVLWLEVAGTDFALGGYRFCIGQALGLMISLSFFQQLFRIDVTDRYAN